ncbi:golgin subfamily A member 6-like protein 6 [Ooceraea biroi]|uniref:golgin subfamily A member 6-like protein 6 n=1 Tax=Ooceraea biroi TaxID=2015173 RepID=UPI000F0828F5|nr:golgin subfamily A member 6-like protein 6 [Ooceraea biroi]
MKTLKDIIDEGKRNYRLMEVRLRIVEEKIEGWNKKWKEFQEFKEAYEEERREREERWSENEERKRSLREAGSSSSIYTRQSSEWLSRGSGSSDDRLSSREVRSMRRLVAEKEKDERKKNIIVRGMSTEGTLEECMIRIQTLLRDKLKVDSKVWQVRRSGRVLIARLENEEEKRKVMKRMCETWIEEKDWCRIKSKLPNSHSWWSVHAEKRKGKGRASGGIIIGKRTDWKEDEEEVTRIQITGIDVAQVKLVLEDVTLNVFTIYNKNKDKNSGGRRSKNKDRREGLEDLFRRIEEICEGEGIIIGRDFNIRIGELESNGEEEYATVRKMNDFIKDRIEEFNIEERVDSDHTPLKVRIQLTEEEEEERRGAEEKKNETEEAEDGSRKYVCWDEEVRRIYNELTEEEEEEEEVDKDAGCETTEAKWRKLKDRVLESLVYKKIGKGRKRNMGYKDWWNKDCTRKKREVKRNYRRWRGETRTKEEFLVSRREFRKLLE